MFFRDIIYKILNIFCVMYYVNSVLPLPWSSNVLLANCMLCLCESWCLLLVVFFNVCDQDVEVPGYTFRFGMFFIFILFSNVSGLGLAVALFKVLLFHTRIVVLSIPDLLVQVFLCEKLRV